MKFRALPIVGIFAALALILLTTGGQPASALAAVPQPVSPAEGEHIVTPTFTWLEADGASRYELEVGPQKDSHTVFWSGQTLNLTLTPVDAQYLPNEPLYWRVRACDSSGSPGEWSTGVNFTKYLPPPDLVSPGDNAFIPSPPSFEWQPVPGAASYRLEISSSLPFARPEYTFNTAGAHLFPLETIPPGAYYWRVISIDAAGNESDPSPARFFTLDFISPVHLYPPDGHANIHTPNFQWQAVAGAVSYTLEVSATPDFNSLLAAYPTDNTQLTPTLNLPHGALYWRVISRDAAGNPGTLVPPVWSFTKTTDAPVLLYPSVNADTSNPTFEWNSVAGATAYRIEFDTASDFNHIFAAYQTSNLIFTIPNAWTPATYYWRVAGVDTAGHVGGYNWRRFTLLAPPAAVDPIPLLINPLQGAALTTGPTFLWSRMIGAASYRLSVSANADFSAPLDIITTAQFSYTPAESLSIGAYPNGSYYWKIEALNASHVIIAASEARSFTKIQPFPLTTPADGATGLISDPTFLWDPFPGAKTYRLLVSTSTDFTVPFDSAITAHTQYVPYPAGLRSTYPNGVYYWKVEALGDTGLLLAASQTCSFTKQQPLSLLAPAAGAIVPFANPDFRWSPVGGARTYRFTISQSADLHPAYDSILTSSHGYSPATPAARTILPNGHYYWKAEALPAAGSPVIAASEIHSFTIQSPLPLFAPLDAAMLFTAPTFKWDPVPGAASYLLVVSPFPGFDDLFAKQQTHYTTYTPYDTGDAPFVYPPGRYYWKILAYAADGEIVTESASRSFNVGAQIYLPAVLTSP